MSKVAGRDDDRRITPVILSGGSGSRLWPLSRRTRPKQMLSLIGERSMLQMTLDRVSGGALFAPPVLVASEAQADAIAEQIGGDAGQYRLILEPAPRNTAAAIALAALAAEPEELLLVMPSDHLIGDPASFAAAAERARALAEQGWLVTFGVRPTRPETGYGYIKRGKPLADGAFQVDSFVEKPDETRAGSYLASGEFEWNAGIFLFRAGAILEALASHAPAVLEACRAAVAGAERDGLRLRPGAAEFAASPSISIDYAVMEHARTIAVVPIDVEWSDVGSWQSLYEVSSTDEHANAVTGEAALVRSSGCLVHSEGPLVVAVGVQDLAIIATGDAILIVPLADSQAVRDAVDQLNATGDSRI